MWRTPAGDRTLQGAEAALFKEALGNLVDMVSDDEEGMWEFNAPPFDALQPNQKLALLAQVGAALLQEDRPALRLTAILEATVAAVYETVRVMVELEIDQPPEWRVSPLWRELVLTACREQGIEELLDPNSSDLDGWEVLVDSLSDGVLWDEDWLGGEDLLDVDPAASRGVKKLMGIDEDYYVAVPPDPSDKEMEDIWATLRGLTSGA